MTKEVKPFKTWDEQIDRLKTKYNLRIRDEDFARHALSSMSYYDLVNGYKECFMENGKFVDYVSIEYLYSFYHFDRTIQNVLFQYSVYVENFFKTALSYVIAKNFGVFQKEYLNKKHYVNPTQKSRKDKRSRLFNKLYFTYNPKNKYLDDPTKHYVYTKAHVPPWILFKNVTFSNSIDLYSFLKSKEKEQVIDILSPGLPPAVLKNSLNVVRKYRNAIAHNLKFVAYRSNIDYIPCIKTIDRIQPFLTPRGLKNDSPYCMLMAMLLLLNDPYLTVQLYTGLSNAIRRSPVDPDQRMLFDDFCRITNFPNNVLELFETYIDNLSKGQN